MPHPDGAWQGERRACKWEWHGGQFGRGQSAKSPSLVERFLPEHLLVAGQAAVRLCASHVSSPSQGCP